MYFMIKQFESFLHLMGIRRRCTNFLRSLTSSSFGVGRSVERCLYGKQDSVSYCFRLSYRLRPILHFKQNFNKEFCIITTVWGLYRRWSDVLILNLFSTFLPDLYFVHHFRTFSNVNSIRLVDIVIRIFTQNF